MREMRSWGCLAMMASGLLGCSATMVNSPGMARSLSPYAPVNEASRGGVVKYLNQGASSVVRQRRDDAYRQMYTACGGSYRINAEGPNAEGGVVIPIQGGGAMWTQSQYWYIQFSCVPPAADGLHSPSESPDVPGLGRVIGTASVGMSGDAEAAPGAITEAAQVGRAEDTSRERAPSLEVTVLQRGLGFLVLRVIACPVLPRSGLFVARVNGEAMERVPLEIGPAMRTDGCHRAQARLPLRAIVERARNGINSIAIAYEQNGATVETELKTDVGL